MGDSAEKVLADWLWKKLVDFCPKKIVSTSTQLLANPHPTKRLQS